MRKKWKRSFVTALSVALAVGNCVPAMAASTGWKQTAAGWQYVNSNGSVQKGWFQDTDGKWYFLDYNTGVMKNGWIKPKDGKWYFMDYHTGAMKTGWIKPKDGKWYYLGASGDMKTGWLQTADGKYYYLDAASGAMQTGTITVNNQVWTLDANGVWDGKAASSVTYVSSGRPSSGGGSSSGTSSTIKGNGWTATKSGVLTINKEGNYKAEDFKKVGTIKQLIISEDVGDGDVTLTDVVVEGSTTISGGGSESVTFLGCKLNGSVKMGKRTSAKGEKGLHVNFGKGTSVKGEVTVEEGRGVKLTMDTAVVIQKITVTASVKIIGGSIIDFIVNTPKLVIIENVIVKNADVSEGGELQVDGKSEIDSIKGTGSITGNANLKEYYDVTLVVNEKEGYWLIEDPTASDPTKQKKIDRKIVKVKTGKSAADAKIENPKSDDKEFAGWLDEEGNPIELSDVNSEKTLTASWTDKEAVIPTITKITATVSGSALDAEIKSNNEATLELPKTVTGAAAGVSVSVEGATVTAKVNDKEVTGKVTSSATSVKLGETIVLTFTPDDKTYAEVRITVTVTVGK